MQSVPNSYFKINISVSANNINFVKNQTSDAVFDNGSDDDVIEVVRDEAPIEILSDGEELEMEQSNQANLNSFSESFSFANPNALETTIEDKLNELEDPLKSLCEIENTFTMTDQIIVEPNVTDLHEATCLEGSSKLDEKSNHDSSGENCFINVTDVGNSTENDAEKLKQKVQEELSKEKEANTIISNVPIDSEIAINNVRQE